MSLTEYIRHNNKWLKQEDPKKIFVKHGGSFKNPRDTYIRRSNQWQKVTRHIPQHIMTVGLLETEDSYGAGFYTAFDSTAESFGDITPKNLKVSGYTDNIIYYMYEDNAETIVLVRTQVSEDTYVLLDRPFNLTIDSITQSFPKPDASNSNIVTITGKPFALRSKVNQKLGVDFEIL